MNTEKNEVISAIKNLTLGDLAVLFGSAKQESTDKPTYPSKEELLATKQYLDKDDIMKMLDCCNTKAYSIINSVKAYSDSLEISGRVLVTDYLAWVNRPRGKDAKQKPSGEGGGLT